MRQLDIGHTELLPISLPVTQHRLFTSVFLSLSKMYNWAGVLAPEVTCWTYDPCF